MGEAKRRRSAKRGELLENLRTIEMLRGNLKAMRDQGVEQCWTPPVEGGKRFDVLDGQSDEFLDSWEASIRAQLEGRAPTKEEVELAVRVWGPGILKGLKLPAEWKAAILSKNQT